MIGVGNFLANTKVTHYRPTIAVGLRGQAVKSLLQLTVGIPVKIEVDTRSTSIEPQIEGNHLHYEYVISIWDELDVQDDDIFEDLTTNKRYKVIFAIPGSLLKMKPYKQECRCKVLGDEEYLEFTKNI